MKESEKFSQKLNKWVKIWNELTDGTLETEEEAKEICRIIPLFKFKPQTAAATCVFITLKKHKNPISMGELCRITTFSPNTIYNIKDYIEKHKADTKEYKSL